jgi:hypothetical protein
MEGGEGDENESDEDGWEQHDSVTEEVKEEPKSVETPTKAPSVQQKEGEKL